MLGQTIFSKYNIPGKHGIKQISFLYSICLVSSLILTISSPLFAFDLPPLDSSNGFSIAGEAVNARLGHKNNAMAGIGDINGDGIDDFALSASNLDYTSLVPLTDSTGHVIVNPETGEVVTQAVTTRKHGRVYILYGRAAGNPFPDNFELAGLITGDEAGNAVDGFAITTTQTSERISSISGNCDINGDGNTDLIIGVPETTVPRPTTVGNVAQAGEIYVVYGHSADESFLADISVENLRDGSGGRRDGGQCPSDGKGCAADGSASLGMFIKGSDARNEAGKSVVCLKSINGDSFDDIFIGTGISDSAATGKLLEQGKAYVLYGAANLPPVFDLRDLDAATAAGTMGFVLSAAEFVTDPNPKPEDPEYVPDPVTVANDFSKFSANAGDMNGDGINDFIIAAPTASPNGNTTLDGKYHSGQTYVIFGRQNNYPAIVSMSDLLAGIGSIGFAINGINVHDRTGSAVSSAGDINNDGFADIIIGAPFVNPDGKGGGQSFIIFGRDPNVSGAFPAVMELADLQTGDGSTGIVINGTSGASGASVAAIGNFDNDLDNLQDVAISAPAHNGSEGAVYIMLGRDKTRPFPAVISLAAFEDDVNEFGFMIHGAEADEADAGIIAYAGDINNDLVPDLLIGAPDANTSNVLNIKTGKVFVVYGATDIAQREVRPESHKGGTPNKTPEPNTRRPQEGVGGFGWLMMGILALFRIRKTRNIAGQ